MERIQVTHDRLVDAGGRHVLLNGINLVFKGEDTPGGRQYIGPWTERDFADFAAWGFNVVRLGLIWDAAEPQPGRYDEAYFDWIGRMLDLCERYGLYAFLDMHQDLYGASFSDGAPDWATLTDGLPHAPEALWSDAYLSSAAVQRAFDHFWTNSPAPDGIGLQDHYAALWQHISRRFASHPAMLGYDVLNEPYPGSGGPQVFGALLGAFAQEIRVRGGPDLTLDDMLAVFADPAEKFKALAYLEDPSFYRRLAEAAEPLVAAFDRGDLDRFYNKMAAAIRAVDSQGILFRENSYFSNMGVTCQAEPIRDAAGRCDPQQLYSPHGYDLVVDTEAIVMASDKRVDVIFGAHRRTQERLQVPVLVGEWGAHGMHAGGLEHIDHLLDLFEANLWGQTYWCYEKRLREAPVLERLRRPRAQAVCGQLLRACFDRQAGTFKMDWDEAGGLAPTRVYLPGHAWTVTADGPYQAESHGNWGFLHIPRQGGRRHVTVCWPGPS